MRLNSNYDINSEFLKKYHFQEKEASETMVVLNPESFFTAELVMLSLGLYKGGLISGQLKLHRSFLSHPTLGDQGRNLAVDFLKSVLPDSHLDAFRSWMTQEEPTWLLNADSLEIEGYTLTSRNSKNWVQVELKAPKVSETEGSSWWSRITGR